MTKQTIIPAGYRLTITSWENDADNYQTTVHEGLTKERVEYLIELCKLFYSGSNNNNATFGNMYNNSYSDKLNELRRKAEDAISEVMKKHRAVLNECELEQLEQEYDPKDKYSGPDYDEFIGELLNYSEHYVYRVFNNAKVEYVPTEIRMDDVTSQFV